MDEKTKVTELVLRYKEAICTQDKEAFRALWCEQEGNTLISVTKRFEGTDRIVDDFLIGGIHASYETIDLIVDDVDVRLSTEDVAIVVFAYCTQCIRRETKEPYGIQGLETQVAIKENGEWKLAHVHYSK